MNLDNVRRDDWIVGGLAVVLVFDLLIFPWFSATVGLGPISISASSSGTGSPDGWLGVLAVLASLAVVVDLAIERLSPQTSVPVLGGSRETTRLVLALAAGCCIALKFLFHIGHFSGIVTYAWGFYLAVVLAGGLVYFAALARKARSSFPAGNSRPGAPAGSAGPAGPPPGPPGPAGPPAA